MLYSMTGFGDAASEFDGMTYTAQIKTVNNKYLKSSLKLPDTIAFLEEQIDKLIRSRITRGTVNLSIRIKSVSAETLSQINTEALAAYVSQLKAVAQTSGISADIDLASLAMLPGIIQPYEPDETTAEKIKQAIIELVNSAIDSLLEMRKSEGRDLHNDLIGYCNEMKDIVANIEQKRDVVVQEYHEKLQKRVDDLLKNAQLNVDQQTLIREVAVFADRSDIAEETSRLTTHLNKFAETCQSDKSVGRKLDFICQEMFREVNTIGSKASDAQICQWVVDLKCRIDRIKEQVQNVE